MTSLQFPIAPLTPSDAAHIHFGSKPFARPACEPEMSERRDILLISADAELCGAASELLMGSGLAVKTLDDSTSGLAECLNASYSLVIVDADLPVLDGIGVIHELRTRSTTPVLLVASSDEQCLAAVEAGADDFVLRPAGVRELATRSRALLKKSGAPSGTHSSTLRCDDLFVNLKTHEAFVGEQQLPLTNIEFAILKCLVRSAGKIVSRDELAAVLYQRKSTPFERSIDVHISHLRKKIEALGKSSIRTIRGIGYLLAPAN
jgi:two-component system response regulator CpxR